MVHQHFCTSTSISTTPSIDVIDQEICKVIYLVEVSSDGDFSYWRLLAMVKALYNQASRLKVTTTNPTNMSVHRGIMLTAIHNPP